MTSELITSLTSGAMALTAAGIAIFGQLRVARLSAQLAKLNADNDRRAELERTTRRYREPLARAAYDLQSRLFNIVKGRFLETFLANGDAREQAYALNNTVFVIAQFFAWTELVRRELQHPKKTRSCFPPREANGLALVSQVAATTYLSSQAG